jgi:hypothetical protein
LGDIFQRELSLMTFAQLQKLAGARVMISIVIVGAMTK